jgi:hypothetical protein
MLHFATLGHDKAGNTVAMGCTDISRGPERTADNLDCTATHKDLTARATEMALRWFAISQLYRRIDILREGKKDSTGERIGNPRNMLSIADDRFWAKYNRLAKHAIAIN